MFRLGTGQVLWKMWREYPNVIGPRARNNALKPLGHSMVIDHIRNTKAQRILEIGHGSNSLTFPLFQDTVECWGLDTDDINKSVPSQHLTRLRGLHPKVRFVDGYIGNTQDTLPDSYFDLVYSVSVLEHIPEDAYPVAFADILRILKPGGVHLHSFDVYWNRPVRPMYEAISAAGFEWLEAQPCIVWDPTMMPPGADPNTILADIVFEHPAVVLEGFSIHTPPEKRIMRNWCTVFVGARKPG